MDFSRKTIRVLMVFVMLSSLTSYGIVPSQVAQAMSSAPINLSFEIKDNQVFLTWDALPGASTYKVYVNDTVARTAITNTSVYLDSTNWKYDRLYKVQVSAVSSTNIEGPLSAHKLAYRPSLSSIRQVSTGGYHTLILRSNGTVSAFGAGKTNTGNSRLHGQSIVPAGLSNVIAVAAGGSHSLALRSDGTVVAWGAGTSGEFAHGQSTVPSGLNNVMRIFVGNLQSYAMKTDGSIVGWGLNATVPNGVSNVLDLVGGEMHSLAILANGTVVGWGNNDYGQISIPTGLANVVQLAAGHYSSLALKSDGTVVAWGAGTTNSGSFPHFGQSIVPSGLSNVTAITAGGQFYMALKTDGTVVSWGSGKTVYSPICQANCVWGYSHHFGQSIVPANLNNVIGIDAGLYNSIIFKKDGTALAWGAGGTDLNTWPQYGQSIVPDDFKVAETIAPSVPTNVVATDILSNRFKIYWDASTDNIAVEGYEIFLNGNLVATSTTTSHTFQSLTQLTNYTVEVRAFDAANNKSAQSSALSVTTGDGTPPTVPSGLSASNILPTEFTLSWLPSTDNVSVSGYRIFVNGAYVGLSNATSFKVTGVTKNSTYSVTVLAFDNLNNTSADSQPLLVTTPDVPPPDITAPSAPATLTASNVTTTSITLNWGAASDNVAVTGYDVFLANSQLASVSGTTLTYNVSGLTTGTSYTFTVKAKDGAGNVSSASNSLTVMTKAAPTNILLSANTIAENNSLNRVVGTLSATDVNLGDTFTYSLVAGTGSTDNALFNISGDSLRASQSFDFEAKSSYSIRIRVTDQDNLTFEKTFVISVTNVNEPATSISLSTSTIAERNGANAIVGTLSHNDPDANQSFTYSLVSGTGDVDNATFHIVGTTLRVTQANAIDFEAKSTYLLRLQVSDGALTFSQPLTITATNVNETPTDISLSDTSIAENAAINTIVATISGSDPDAGATLSYAFVAGAGATDNASFTISGVLLSANESFNYEQKNSYSVRIQASDGSLNYSELFTISVIDVNEAPIAGPLSLEVAEDTEYEGTFSAVDEDGDSLTYYIATQPSKGTLTLNSTTGEYIYMPNANVSGADSFVYKAWDGALASNYVTVSVVIRAVNDAPTDLELSVASIVENSGVGAIVGEWSAVDTDVGDTLTYSLVSGAGDGDNAFFAIDGATLLANSDFDFESKESYTVRVQVSDGALTFEQSFAVNVIDVNETPTSIALSNHTITEGSDAGTAIGEWSAADPDAGSTFHYELVSGVGDTDNEQFFIDGTTLRLSAIADYEAQSSYTVRIQVSDGEFTYEQSFTISVMNKNEGPTSLALSNDEIEENNAVHAVIGILSSTHEDSEATLTFALVAGVGDADNSRFQINGSELRASEVFDFESKSEHAVRIAVSDGSQTFEQPFIINVTDSNDAPNSLALDGNRVAENVWVDFEIGELSAVDADLGETFTYTLVAGEGDTDNANFKIEGSTLKAAIVFDYLEKSLHTIRVRVTDAGAKYDEQVFEIEVIQSNAYLNATNKVVTIYFQDHIFNVYNNLTSLKNAVTITRNANASEPMYEPLGPNDQLSIRGNRLVIEFENQVTGYYNRIKIAGNALKDRLGYKAAEQLTTPLVVDSTGPSLIKVTMDKKKKELLLQFSERLYMATSGANPKEITDKFKAAITFSRNGSAFSALAARDKVTLSGRYLEISLATPLSTNDNKVKIAASVLKDLIGNLSAEIVTEEIDLDASGPILSKVTLGPDNKTITILLNEEANNTASGVKAAKLAALRAAIQISTNANVAVPTYAALGTNDMVDLNKGVLTIKLATALTSAHNKIKIASGIVKDIFGNTNSELTTSTIVADKFAPFFVKTDLPLKRANRTLVITLNETISNGFTSGKTAENKEALKAAVKIKTDSGEFVALKAIDQVRVSGKTMQITFAAPLVKDKQYQVKIAVNALQDLTGNKNEEIITDTFVVDTTGPKLR